MIDIEKELVNVKNNQAGATSEYETSKLQFAKMLKQINLDINANKQSTKRFTTQYSKEQIQKYLESPKQYEKELRAVTRALCVLSPQFNRLVGYIPDMAMFCYTLIPSEVATNPTKALKDYTKWGKYLDNLNISHEFNKIIKSNFKYDVYYGYVLEETDSFYIKTLDPDYCKIVTIDDGCFNFAFDFTFFDISDNKLFLEYYPKEFTQKYNKFKAEGYDVRWQELDSNYTICTKFYEDMINITYPPYCNTFNDLYDISDYKQIDKQSAENENYQLIGLQLETMNGAKESNAFSVDPTMAMEYYSLIQSSLPEGIGAFLTPVKWDSVNFNNSTQSKIDRVENATRNFWDSAGVASVLFNSGATNAGTLKYSMLVDTNMLFGLYRQLERWLNRKLKRQFNGKVSIKLLDIHRLNQTEFIDQSLKLAQYGIPTKSTICSAIGLSPIEMLALNSYETDVLELHTKFIPLSSSYTQTGDGESGRPQSDATDLSPSGQSTRDTSANDNRG